MHQAESILAHGVAPHREHPEFVERHGVVTIAMGARAGQDIGPRIRRQADEEDCQNEDTFHSTPNI